MNTSNKDLIRRTIAKILAVAMILGFVPSAILQTTMAADGESGYVGMSTDQDTPARQALPTRDTPTPTPTATSIGAPAPVRTTPTPTATPTPSPTATSIGAPAPIRIQPTPSPCPTGQVMVGGVCFSTTPPACPVCTTPIRHDANGLAFTGMCWSNTAGEVSTSYRCPVYTSTPIPTITPTYTPTPTPLLSCNQICSTNAQCGTGFCYQPPMPYCPPGTYCPQVMPAKVCRSAQNPSSPTCSTYVTPSPTYTTNPSPCPLVYLPDGSIRHICPTPSPSPTACPTDTYREWWSGKCIPYPTPTPTYTPTPTPTSQTDLEIVKSDYRTTAKPGDTLTYYLTVTNHGPTNAFPATISDQLPAAFDASSVVWTCDNCVTTYGQGSLNMSTTANILSTQTLSVVISARVRRDFTGNIVNFASVNTPNTVSDTNPANNISRDDTMISGTINPTPTYCPGGYWDAYAQRWNCSTPTPTYAPTPCPYGYSWDWWMNACKPVPTPTYTPTYCPYGQNWDNSWNGCRPTPTPSPTYCPLGYSWDWWMNACKPNPTPTPYGNTVDLDITKTHNTGRITAGSNIYYTITVTNRSSSPANPAYIHDSVPSQINPATITWTCPSCTTTSGSGQSYVATTAYIPAYGSVVLNISGQIYSYVTGAIQNTAYVDPAQNVTDTNVSNNGYRDVANIDPTSTSCPYGQYWDTWWNGCRINSTPTPTYNPGNCQYNYYWDSYYGRCMPYATPTPTYNPQNCQYGYSWDWWSQTCKINNYTTPTPNYCYNGNNGPQCQCTSGQYWDSYSNVCRYTYATATPNYCASDTQRCSDGSYVGRNPANNCNFYSCSNTNNYGQQIGIAKAASSVSNMGDGSSQTTYTVTLSNMGSATLTNVQVNDDLRATFPSPTTFSVSNLSATNGLSVNNSYNGSNVTNLLNSNSSLVPYGSSTITFTVRIWMNNYSYQNYQTSQTFSNNAQAQAYNGSQYFSDWSVNGYNADPDGDGNPTNNTSATVITIANNGYNNGNNNTCGNNLCSNIQIQVPANATCSQYNICSTGTGYNYGSVQCDNSSACVQFTCNAGYQRVGNQCVYGFNNTNNGNGNTYGYNGQRNKGNNNRNYNNGNNYNNNNYNNTTRNNRPRQGTFTQIIIIQVFGLDGNNPWSTYGLMPANNYYGY